MRLHSVDLENLSQLAKRAAKEAGRYIQSRVKDELKIESKLGGSSLASQVVTAVDLESQKIILEILAPSLTQYDLALLTEESEDDQSRFEKEYFWCIDPLDGTLPFTEAIPGYAVSIALVSRSGESLIGVIYDPVKEELYHAVKAQGAFCNDLALEPKSEAKYLTLVNDRSFKNHLDYEAILKSLEGLAIEQGYEEVKTILFGGAAMNAIWVLQNTPAFYFKFPKLEDGGGSLWDYAASACLFKELGGHVSDIFGEDLDLNRVDSSFMNHRGICYVSDERLVKKLQVLLKAYLP